MCLFVPSAIFWNQTSGRVKGRFAVGWRAFKRYMPESQKSDPGKNACWGMEFTFYLSALSLPAGGWQMPCPVGFQASRTVSWAQQATFQLLYKNPVINTHVLTIFWQTEKELRPFGIIVESLWGQCSGRQCTFTITGSENKYKTSNRGGCLRAWLRTKGLSNAEVRWWNYKWVDVWFSRNHCINTGK